MEATPNPIFSQAKGSAGQIVHQDFTYRQPFSFENGDSLPEFTLRYETYGTLNAERSNAILICHALSGDHHCAGIYSADDHKQGWWDIMVGPDKPIDTKRFFVVCSNCLGGCQGSSGPSSINPQTGKPYNLTFPQLTIQDMVQAQALLMDDLDIAQWHSVIGGSMGGMQALQWSISFPERVRSIIALATTARQNAQVIAFNAVGRSAIIHDPKWNQGEYQPNEGPNCGLAIARMMAHITYLSNHGMETKFGRTRRENTYGKELLDIEFEVESYLNYQGKRFVDRFDPNSYLYLTKALDRFDLYGEENCLENAVASVQARCLIIGFSSDWLYPTAENRAIVHALLRCGKKASYAEVAMELGHDSFLIRSPELFKYVHGFLHQ